LVKHKKINKGIIILGGEGQGGQEGGNPGDDYDDDNLFSN